MDGERVSADHEKPRSRGKEGRQQVAKVVVHRGLRGARSTLSA
jgi:hypothetical protein